MLPGESPFPPYWWGTGLEKAGLADARPDISTYGRYDFDRLPPLPLEMKGDLGWLTSVPECPEHSIEEEASAQNAEALTRLLPAVARVGITLPPAFVRFMETPELQKRIRSSTDCYLDLCPQPVPSPVGEGYLVRFLADSQGCLFWYLYLTADGEDHAVVSSGSFYGTEEEQWQDEPPDAADLVYNAESFEAFLCRFWLENEIWFAEYCGETPMPPVGQHYIDLYKAT